MSDGGNNSLTSDDRHLQPWSNHQSWTKRCTTTITRNALRLLVTMHHGSHPPSAHKIADPDLWPNTHACQTVALHMTPSTRTLDAVIFREWNTLNDFETGGDVIGRTLSLAITCDTICATHSLPILVSDTLSLFDILAHQKENQLWNETWSGCLASKNHKYQHQS